MRQSRQYELYVRQLDAFLGSFIALTNAANRALAGQGHPFGVDSSLDLLRDEDRMLIGQVSVAAGAATDAAMKSGVQMQMFEKTFNPVVDWPRAFIGTGFTPGTVISYTHQVIGMWQERAATAKAHETGLAGAIARFVRFPSEVREAAGLSSRAGQTGAFAVGVAAQVVATVIGVGVLALIGKALAGL